MGDEFFICGMKPETWRKILAVSAVVIVVKWNVHEELMLKLFGREILNPKETQTVLKGRMWL